MISGSPDRMASIIIAFINLDGPTPLG